MALTASELRRDIYRLLDRVLETGVPLEVRRGEQLLTIRPLIGPTKLESLPLRNLFACDPDELVSAPLSSSHPETTR